MERIVAAAAVVRGESRIGSAGVDHIFPFFSSELPANISRGKCFKNIVLAVLLSLQRYRTEETPADK